MPPKSCAQRQRERRERLKAGGQYADYKKKQSEYHRQWEQQKKLAMSAAQKKEKTEYERQRKAKYR